MWGVENGAVVFQSRCNSGVWQGDPLGAQCMGLAILDFCKLLIAKLKLELVSMLANQGLAREDVVPALEMVNSLEELEKIADRPEAFLDILLTEAA